MAAEFAESESQDAKRTWVDAMYRKYGPMLRRYLARQRVSQEAAADIVQETYCRVLQAGNVDAIHNPKAFLLRVALNVRLNQEKHRRIGVEDESLDIEKLEVAADDPGPYRSFKGEQELEIARAAIDALPATCRDAFIMNRFEDMTFRQIAEELDLSVSMVEKHVSHAIASIRACVGEGKLIARHDSQKVRG